FVRLGGCDLIIFSAGIGENEPRTRREIIEAIGEALHVKIDNDLNNTIHGKEALISTPDSQIKVAVIPTDEEVMIARDAYQMCIKEKK
ncbi:MAG: acetate kinase, partial [Bacilli bacterium]